MPTEPADDRPAGPTLHEGVLDAEGLEGYANDLAACADVESVRTRTGTGAPDASVDVRTALDALARGELHSVQLRYAHAGDRWCDTLIAQGEVFRVVRVELDRATDPPTHVTETPRCDPPPSGPS